MKSKKFYLAGFTLITFAFLIWYQKGPRQQSFLSQILKNQSNKNPSQFAQLVTLTPPSPTPTSTPTPTPTPKPLTFAQLNELYGPCLHAPTLMYHHVQSQEEAAASVSTSLTVFTDTFRSQMEYLQQRGYNPISMLQLVSFFDQGTAAPGKPVLLTFDDGYQDFSNNAWPILREMGFKATVFLPTGLMDNPGYLSWSQIQDISSSGNVSFSNHTWSHRNSAGARETVEKEITLADTQLIEHGLNNPKVFSYPYGFSTGTGQQILNSRGYTVAFTTVPGSTLCKQRRLTLPRIRIGNTSLSSYGF